MKIIKTLFLILLCLQFIINMKINHSDIKNVNNSNNKDKKKGPVLTTLKHRGTESKNESNKENKEQNISKKTEKEKEMEKIKAIAIAKCKQDTKYCHETDKDDIAKNDEKDKPKDNKDGAGDWQSETTDARFIE